MIVGEVPLETITISNKTLLDLRGDFYMFLDGEYARKKALRDAWYDDVASCFGYDPYFDNDYHDWYETQYYNETLKKIYGFQKKHPIKNTMSRIRGQRFINGIEVDSNISDDDALSLILGEARNTRQHHKTRRGGRKRNKKRYTGGSSSRYKREFYNEWDIGEEDEGNDCQLDRCNELELDDFESEKKIIVYRYLNNTADIYEFNSPHEFSDWLDENDVMVDDEDAYEIMYRDETHCAFNPATSAKKLICAASYDDLVWCITGGDVDYLAEISSRSCPV